MPNEAEIVVVGGGITGITSAYLLAREGKRVVVLEKEKIGEGVTANTTAMLTEVIDIDPMQLVRTFGEEKARLILASHREAIDEVEKIIETEKIECEFKRCANYVYAQSPAEEKTILKMAEAFHQLGVRAEYKKDASLKFQNIGYLQVPNQAKFDAAKYVAALTESAKKHGARIFEHTEVLDVDDQGDFVIVEIKDTGSVQAKKILSATYAPFGNPPCLSHRANRYRSYVVEYKLPAGIFVEGIYQDIETPYHYFRIDKEEGYDRMLFGGADDLEAIGGAGEINFHLLRDCAEKTIFTHLSRRNGALVRKHLESC